MSLSIWSHEQDVSDSDAETGGKRKRKEEKKREWVTVKMWMGKLLREVLPTRNNWHRECNRTASLPKSNGRFLWHLLLDISREYDKNIHHINQKCWFRNWKCVTKMINFLSFSHHPICAIYVTENNLQTIIGTHTTEEQTILWATERPESLTARGWELIMSSMKRWVWKNTGWRHDVPPMAEEERMREHGQN